MVPVAFQRFKQKITNPLFYIYFMLTRLPITLVVGLKLLMITETKAEVRVKNSWINKNPFQSIYFAILAMAAELSTGILCFAHAYQRNREISMLITKCEGSFYKKGLGKVIFVCNDGAAIKTAIEKTLQSGEKVILQCTSTGTNEQQEEIAKFVFTWSFKAK